MTAEAGFVHNVCSGIFQILSSFLLSLSCIFGNVNPVCLFWFNKHTLCGRVPGAQLTRCVGAVRAGALQV